METPATEEEKELSAELETITETGESDWVSESPVWSETEVENTEETESTVLLEFN